MVFELKRELIHKMSGAEIAEMSQKERDALPAKYLGLPVIFRRTLADGSVGKESFRLGVINKAYLNPREGIYADLRLEGNFSPELDGDGKFTALIYKV